jgi:N-succinyldiaminopimelate aminotransferase
VEPGDVAVAACTTDNEDGFFLDLATQLQTKRDLLCAGLRDLGLEVFTPKGTYFALADVSSLGYADAMAFCLALPERAGVVAIPAQVFYDNQSEGRHLVRWAFCKEPDVIEQALERLGKAQLAC